MTTALHDLSDLLPENIIPAAVCRKMLKEAAEVVDEVTDDDGRVDPFFRLVTLEEDGTRYKLSVELPQEQVRDVEVNYQDGSLWVTGWRSAAKTSDGRFEFFEDSFRRVIPLPHDVDPHSFQAEHDEHTLVIVAAKRPASHRHVPVKQP